MSKLNTEPLTVYHAFLSDSDDDEQSKAEATSPILTSHLQATERELEAHRSVLSGRRVASLRQQPSNLSSDLKQYAISEMSKRDDQIVREKSVRQEVEKKLVDMQHDLDEARQSVAAGQRREKVMQLKISSQEEVIATLRAKVDALESETATLRLRKQNSMGVKFVSKNKQDPFTKLLISLESNTRERLESVMCTAHANLCDSLHNLQQLQVTVPLLLKGLRTEQHRNMALKEEFERNVLLMTESRDGSRIMRHFRSLLAQLARQQEEAELVPEPEPPVAMERPLVLPPPPWYPPGKTSSIAYHPMMSLGTLAGTQLRASSPSPRRASPSVMSSSATGPVSRTKSPVPVPQQRSASQPRSPQPQPTKRSPLPVARSSRSPVAPAVRSASPSAAAKPKTAITYLRFDSPKPPPPTVKAEPRVIPLALGPELSPIPRGGRSSSPSVAVAHDIESLIKELEKWRPS